MDIFVYIFILFVFIIYPLLNYLYSKINNEYSVYENGKKIILNNSGIFIKQKNEIINTYNWEECTKISYKRKRIFVRGHSFTYAILSFGDEEIYISLFLKPGILSFIGEHADLSNFKEERRKHRKMMLFMFLVIFVLIIICTAINVLKTLYF